MIIDLESSAHFRNIGRKRLIFSLIGLSFFSFISLTRASGAEEKKLSGNPDFSKGNRFVGQQKTDPAKAVQDFCHKIDGIYDTLEWGKSPCDKIPWTFDRLSEGGEPLVYWEYVDKSTNGGNLTDDSSETTLLLGGVHPDEFTPIHLAFRFAEELQRDPTIYVGKRVIIAPLVNPDGFFAKKIHRTNSNGVDLNRNFATRDWWAQAQKQWLRRKSDARHFPGKAPQTEEGTKFQADLLERYSPDKVLSIHAPLGWLDYDGPGDEKKSNLSEQEKRARDLASVISKKSQNYRIIDYRFYPGSLGNYSGQELSIPTITVELASTDPKLVGKYWKEFYPGLKAAVQYDFRKSVIANKTEPARKPKAVIK